MSTTTDATETTETTAEPSPETDPVRSTRTIVLGLLGIGIVGVGLWPTAGELGLVAVAVLGLVWYRLSELYTVALGHAVFLWLLPTGSLSPELLIAEFGLLVVLVAPALEADAPGAVIVATVAALGGLIAIAAGSYWWRSDLWIAAAVLLGALLGGGYTLYRYELVRLDLVEEGRPT